MSFWLIAASAAGVAAGDAGAAAGADTQVERKLDEEIVVTGERPSFKTDVVQVGAFRNQSRP